nr:reductive dehalogenase [uncultured bacterium]
MSKFHSTVSRRDFMKSIGLAGAGLGAASLLNPSFNNLDEVVSASNTAEYKRAWYVKEQDFAKPTVEVDWQTLKSYDKSLFQTGDFQKINDKTKALGLQLEGTVDRDESLAKWAQNGTKGMSLRDQALWRGAEISRRFEPSYTWTHKMDKSRALTPEELGVPVYQGTPEDNTRMMRVVGRMYGVWNIGVTEIDEYAKKIIWSNDGKKNIVFEDVDAGYETDAKRVIPNKCKYVVSLAIRHGELATKTAPGAIVNSAQQNGYFDAAHASTSFQEFLYALGYQGVGNTSPAGSASFPVMSGIGELGRGAHVVTPEHGAMYRRFPIFFTDLPLEPTKPIDSGIHKFCYTCKKCGLHCPTSSIPIETEPTWEGHGPWNNPGIKSWYLNYPTCGGPFDYKSTFGPGYCGMCLTNCVFSKLDNANIHGVVMATASTTSLFNAFFNTMDDAFGYGQNWRAHEKGDTYVEDWWNTIGPERGYLTRTGM